MKTLYHYLMVLLFATTAMGQTSNESLDYYTDLAGNKHYGTINFKNNNALEGSVLFSKGDKSRRIPLSEIEYFELASGERYYAYENQGTYQLLKVLVYGRLTLLTNDAAVNKQFFYKKDNEPIVYLELLVLNDVYGKKRPHNIFQKQLHDDLKIDNKEMSDYFKIEYNQNDLTNYAIAYNESIASPYEVFTSKKRKVVAFVLYGGPSLNTFSYNSYPFSDRNETQRINYQIGTEVEFRVLRSLSFPVRVEYSSKSFSKNTTFSFPSVTEEFYAKYNIDLNFFRISNGIRYTHHINKKHAVYVDTFFTYDFFINSKYDVKAGIATNQDGIIETGYELEYTWSARNFYYSLGYMNKDKYGVELRFTNFGDLYFPKGDLKKINEIGLNFRYILN